MQQCAAGYLEILMRRHTSESNCRLAHTEHMQHWLQLEGALLPPSRRRCTRGLTTKTGHYYTYRCAMPGALGAGGGAGFGAGLAPPARERWDEAVVTGATWATVAAAPAFLDVYEVIDAALLRAVFPCAALAVILPVPSGRSTGSTGSTGTRNPAHH